MEYQQPASSRSIPAVAVVRQTQKPPRIPGRVKGNKLVKTVKARNRMSRPFSGWGLSVEQLKSAQAKGAQLVELRVDSGEVLTASLSRILTEGRPIHHLGWEPQLLVPLRTWAIEDPTQCDLFGGSVS